MRKRNNPLVKKYIYHWMNGLNCVKRKINGKNTHLTVNITGNLF